MTISQVIRQWQALQPSPDVLPEVFAQLAERALAIGEPLLAYDVTRSGLSVHSTNVRLRQLQALSLARSGAPDTARLVLERLCAEGHADVETLGMLGRACKDLAEKSDPGPTRLTWMTKAAERYETAHRLHGGIWSGINAATLAVCLGQPARAAQIAQDVKQSCEKLLADPAHADSYWTTATLGEALLVLGQTDAAAACYATAMTQLNGRIGDLAATRRNAKLVCSSLGLPLSRVDEWLPLPRVVLFCGHMIDMPGRATPRFPARLEQAAAAEIRQRLDRINAGIGFTSGACGADILFAEAILDRGGELHVVLPHDPERFVADSVTRGGPQWVKRYNAIVEHPRVRVSIASHCHVLDEGLAYEYANQYLRGLAAIRTWQLGAELAPLAVWDGRPGDGPGGTAWTVAQWREAGLDVSVIDPAELNGPVQSAPPLETESATAVDAPAEPPAASSQPMPGLPTGFTPRMRALLFADVVGFSRLPEQQIPVFAMRFLGGVADLVHPSKHPPVLRNTWGDGLYMVFETVANAGFFALELQDWVESVDWRSHGFENGVRLRIALHYGPVFSFFNPLTEIDDFIGAHVSRAARIEPITPHGQVYASEVFAAIAFAGEKTGFTCEYVGTVGLAKEFGDFPTYHVRRGRAGPA